MKKSLVILSLAVSSVHSAPVAIWDIEEGLGTITIESVDSVASDAFGTGVIWSNDVPGPASTASLSFPGTGAGNLRTNLDATTLGINGTVPKTITGWIKCGDTAGATRMFFGWTPTNGLTNGADIRLGLDGSGFLRLEVTGGFALYNTTALDDNAWHMVGVVIEENDNVNSVQFYIDGNLFNPTSAGDRLINTQGTSTDTLRNDIYLGIGNPQGTQQWAGLLDDVRIHDTALSDTELDAIRDAMAIAAPPTLIWNNASSDGLWNTASFNWNDGSSDIAFADGDKVSFNDLVGATETVAIPATVSPSRLTFDTFSTDYTFTGAGAIACTEPIALGGGGYTSFANTGGITTTGPMILADGGWLSLGTQATPASTTIESGGLLEFLNGGSIAGPVLNSGSLLDSSNTGTVTVSGAVSGSGGIDKDGPSTLLMEAVNTYTGNTVVNAGVLEVGPSGGLYHGGYRNTSFLTINAGGTVRVPVFFYNATGAGQGDLGGLPDYSVHRQINGGTIEVTGNSHSSGNDFQVSAAGGTFRYTATGETLSLDGNANDNIRLSGPLTFDAIGNIAVAEVIQDGTATGSIVKTGAGTLTLTGTNTYSGDTTVSEGVLAVDGDALGNGTSLVIDGGVVEPTGTETVDTLFFGATQQAAGTWGATGSGATHIDNTRFAGTAGVINVTTGPGLAYTTWAAANANGDGPELDSDGDGVPNGVEFLMGETGSSFTPNPALVNGTVTWPKDPTALASWVIETSTNLQDEVTPGDGGWTTTTTGVTDNGTSIEFTPASDGNKLFIRLRVAIP